jgi:hypothetical protein
VISALICDASLRLCEQMQQALQAVNLEHAYSIRSLDVRTDQWLPVRSVQLALAGMIGAAEAARVATQRRWSAPQDWRVTSESHGARLFAFERLSRALRLSSGHWHSVEGRSSAWRVEGPGPRVAAGVGPGVSRGHDGTMPGPMPRPKT